MSALGSLAGSSTDVEKPRSGTDLKAREIWQRVVRDGEPQTAVAEEMKIHRSTIWRYISDIAREMPEITAEEKQVFVQIQLERLEKLEQKSWKALDLCDDSDTLGIQRLTNSILKVQARRSALLALDAPKRIEIEGLVANPLAVSIERVRGELAS